MDTRSREAVVAVARICLRVNDPNSPLLDRVQSWVRVLPYLAPHSQNDAYSSALVRLALLVAASTTTHRASMLSAAVTHAMEELSRDKGVIDSIDIVLTSANSKHSGAWPPCVCRVCCGRYSLFAGVAHTHCGRAACGCVATRGCGSLATVPHPTVAVCFGAAQARAQDTLVYSPLAALFGVLRGVGTSTARNRFDEVLSIRAFEVLDSLLEQLAQDHTQSKYTSSAISVTRLNLGTLRAVILMVRRPSLTL